MPLAQDNKNGNAPMGSIKDRIKSFEVMKESGTTSPRARSPITEFTADNHKTIRRTINWERDGTERRQIRRSERKEAQLRREHEVTQDNNEIDTSDEKNVRSTRKVNERRPPRIAPKVKEKPSESSLRRKSQEYKDARTTVQGKIQEADVKTSSSPPTNIVSPRNTESSSNETIDLNTSDDLIDMSSEDTEEREQLGNVEEKKEERKKEMEEEEDEEDGEDEEDEEDKEEEEEEEEEDEEEEEEEEEEEKEDNDEGKINKEEQEKVQQGDEEVEKKDQNGDDDGRLQDKTVMNNRSASRKPKRLSSHSGNEEVEDQPDREQTNGKIASTEVFPERGKTKNIQECHSTGNKGKSKATKRKSSRNSIKSQPEERLDETNKQHGEKSAESKTQPASRDEENDSSSGDEDIFNQGQNDMEIISTSTQLSIHSSNVLGMIPVNIEKSENERMQSPDTNHEDIVPKKAFICPIHEENCKYYCQNCERLICSECAMRWGDCHEHYYLRVKDAWKKYREEMMKILQEAKSSVSRIQDDILENSKARDSFKLKVDSTIKKINSFFDQHVQALEKRRTSFLETVEETLKFREIGINQEIEYLQNNLVETSGTINIAGRVYGSSTMMEFLQVCKQLSNHLLELGQKKMKTHLMENVDIDFISEPNLYEEIEKLGQLKKRRLSAAPSFDQLEGFLDDSASEKNQSEKGKANKLEEPTERRASTDSDFKLENSRKVDLVAEDSMDTSLGTSTENLSESTSAKDTNNIPRKQLPLSHESARLDQGMKNVERKPINENGIIVNSIASECFHKTGNDEKKDEHEKLMRVEEQYEIKLHKGLNNVEQESRKAPPELNDDLRTVSSIKEENIEACFCRNGIEYEKLDSRNGLSNDSLIDERVAPKTTSKENAPENPYPRRHSMDDAIGSRSKKEEIQRRLGNMGKLKPQKSAQFMDEGERYFSSGEAEQRRRKQEYYKVRFNNDRAYYSNPSDSSELEEMRGYDLEENDRPSTRQRVRRHRTMPLIRPISERRDKSPWSLDVFRYHGKIHFSRNSLKATGKAFGWNAVIGSQAFSQGRHSWKVRVTKWTAVGVCYKDDHVNNPSWGAGNKWTWDSADMCFSPRLGVCESPVGEWIDGDVIALELDCDNSVLIVHNLRTSESDKLFGFKEPVYPYFYLSVFRSISLIEIDGVQVE